MTIPTIDNQDMRVLGDFIAEFNEHNAHGASRDELHTAVLSVFETFGIADIFNLWREANDLPAIKSGI